MGAENGATQNLAKFYHIRTSLDLHGIYFLKIRGLEIGEFCQGESIERRKSMQYDLLTIFPIKIHTESTYLRRWK